ncbi:MAG: hypothetical protein KC492_20290 [Myxococcales bacterium]|nr:hypothetical protein [Myxococcales bacterium]MCB9608328.1 hypothetical protein [Polyangiaceae bacterium]
MRLLGILVASLVLGACSFSEWHAMHKTATAGQVGCSESELVITDYEVSEWTNTGSWKASCHGKAFICSKYGADITCNEHVGVGSTPKASAEPSSSKPTPVAQVVAPATPAQSQAEDAGDADPGCHYDTQCKGDRICRNHECVDP